MTKLTTILGSVAAMIGKKVCSLCSCASLAMKVNKNVTGHRRSRNFSSAIEEPEDEKRIRKNVFSVPMIDENLNRLLFKNEFESSLDSFKYEAALKLIKEITKTEEFDKILSMRADGELFKRKRKKSSKNNSLPFDFPELFGCDLKEHFEHIASNLVADYKKMLIDFSEIESLPQMPEQWARVAGWTRYDKNGKFTSIDFPDDDVLVFDVETCVKEGSLPVMATAVSKDFWYSWCSPRLTSVDIYSAAGLNSNGSFQISSCDLIPFESKQNDKYDDFERRKRIVIGHNVSYDRSYIREQYFIQGTKLRFFDTMSTHIACNGLAGDQRIAFMSYTKGKGIPGRRRLPTSESRKKAVDGLVVEKNVGFLNSTNGNKIKSRKLAEIEEESIVNDENEQNSLPNWVKNTSMSGLLDIHNLYCGKKSKLNLDKVKRNVFVEGQMEDIRADFNQLMTYCAIDVAATFEIYKPLVKEMFDRFPHPVSLFGTLEMSTAFLPVNENWLHYIKSADETFAKDSLRIRNILRKECNSMCNLIENDKYKSDLWMFHEDWATNDAWPIKKDTKRKYEETPEQMVKRFWNESYEFKDKTKMSKFPNWYRKLLPKEWEKFDIETWDDAEREINIIEDNSFDFDLTARRYVTPKILRMVWNGYPLYHSKKYGWGYLKLNNEKLAHFGLDSFKLFDNDDVEFPLKEFTKYIRENDHDIKFSDDEYPKILEEFRGSPVEFYMLPHPDGHGDLDSEPKNNVGNPLSKSFTHYVDQKLLRSEDPKTLSKLMDLSKQCSYWQNNSDRIKQQIIIWLDENLIPPNLKNTSQRLGIILPRLIVSGTVTRRAVEKTWMTVSNAKKDRIGSEMKGIIQTPEGYCFVGADVDSQELWIAGLLGDSSKHQVHGCTPIGYMILKGSKADKTDQHTVVAEQLQISRDQAKILNYGRLYGAGLKFATLLLQQFRPSDDKKSIKLLAENLYKLTKGEKKRKNIYNGETSEYVKTVSYWENGSESDMFNCLEKIARSKQPATPVLKCRISKSLEPQAIGHSFLPSRVNWIIQSSAVDFLHSMLVCMRWLCDKYDINARFALSVHDEVRYFVKEDDKYRAALALQLTNLLTRAFFVKSVGMTDLPDSVAFFSRVDIDKVLRKEVDDDNLTPSNPLGLKNCYGIPLGEALTMDEIVEKTKGSLKKSFEEIPSKKKRDIIPKKMKSEMFETAHFNDIQKAKGEKIENMLEDEKVLLERKFAQYTWRR